jgi:class 3 adenylate cyclase
MSTTTLFNPSTRHAVARLIARYFLVHLRAEVQKPDDVLQEDYPDLPVRQMNYDLMARVRREFHLAEDEPLPEDNIFERWCEINGKFHYFDSGLIGYSRIFYPRLLDLRDGTAETRDTMHRTMRNSFDNFDYEKQGFTVAFFLESASNMRELLRQVIYRDLPDIAEEGDRIILEQSRSSQTAMYEYFEGILKKTLADNVRLLHGILPQKIVTELRERGRVEPVHFPEAAVLFTDFEKFSQYTAYMSPQDVLHRLDLYFSEFDRISAQYGLEKIKTIGDSYMAVAGVPEQHRDPVRAVCDAALDIREASNRISDQFGLDGWHIRIGVHVGPLIAGVIGRQKFSYDVWGATVNLASRMESGGEPGMINASADIYARVTAHYEWEPRGPQPIKRLGTAEMYFLKGKKGEAPGGPAAISLASSGASTG